MKTHRVEIEHRLEHLKDICGKAGLRLTPQRREIFREVARNCDHPDAETIYKAVRRRVPSVSRDTVYRTLWTLTDLGLISALGTSQDRTRFDANLEPHHHFVCATCGLTRDFQSCELDDLPIPDSVKTMGSIRKVRVEVTGLCVTCERKKRPGHK